MLTLNEARQGSNALMNTLNSGELKNPILQDLSDGGGTHQVRITIQEVAFLAQSL